MTATVEGVLSIPTHNREGDDMRFDATQVSQLLQEAEDRMRDLAEDTVSVDRNARLNSSERAEITKELLFIAHLCRKAEIVVLDQYHAFKGETAHLVGGRRR